MKDSIRQNRRYGYSNNSFLDESSGGHGGNKRPKKRKVPIGIIIFADILIAALVLLVFYLSTYVWEKEITAEPLIARTSATAQTSPDTTAVATQDTQARPDAANTGEPDTTQALDMTIWRNKFADKFTDGEVIQTDNSYRSANINVSIQKHDVDGTVYFVADIYIADIKYFKTSFGENRTSGRQFIDDNLVSNNGIIGINGDNCWTNSSLLIRNGIYYDLYSRSSSDALVMYIDGSMETISGRDFSFEETKALAPYQVWGFGPMLLDADGQSMSEFNSTVAGKKNPHTAVGYYEPGHYCFVVVDGRSAETYSAGMTMTELSQLMYDLNCTVAFSLDGGGTTQMAFMDSYYNIPSVNRMADDMIYITDSEE